MRRLIMRGEWQAEGDVGGQSGPPLAVSRDDESCRQLERENQQLERLVADVSLVPCITDVSYEIKSEAQVLYHVGNLLSRRGR